MQMPSSTHWTPSLSLSPASRLSPRQNPPCRSRETGLLPLRQTPSRSQVELPVTMRQPLETDGLQTACHVYCCCHKRQESNNTLPQEPHGIAQGPANSCLGGAHWPCTLTYIYTHTHTHLELTPTITTIQMPLLLNTHTHLQRIPTQKTARHALQMSSANLSGHATFTAIKQACHLNI